MTPPAPTGRRVGGVGPLFGRNMLLYRTNPQSVMSAVVAPVVFFFGFYAVMSRTMEAQGIDYAQFLPPAIIVQAMFFTAIASGFFLASDVQSGIIRRIRTLPVSDGSLLVARSLADAARAALSLVVVVALASIVGFRFEVGPAAALAFGAIALAFAVVVGIGCGAVGLAKGDPESTAALLIMPYLPLLMLSTGFVPEEAFPDWLEPVVAASPVSAVVNALRSLSTGGPLVEPVATAVAWLLVLGAIFVWAGARALRRAS